MVLDGEPRKLRSAFGLLAVFAVLAVLLVVLLMLMMANRRARRLVGGAPRRKRRRPIADAWVEAGRRVEPIRMDEPEPPTLGEEPDDERR